MKNDWIKVTPETLPPPDIEVCVACRMATAKSWSQLIAYYDADAKEWIEAFSDKPIESEIDSFFVFYWRLLFKNPEL